MNFHPKCAQARSLTHYFPVVVGSNDVGHVCRLLDTGKEPTMTRLGVCKEVSSPYLDTLVDRRHRTTDRDSFARRVVWLLSDANHFWSSCSHSICFKFAVQTFSFALAAPHKLLESVLCPLYRLFTFVASPMLSSEVEACTWRKYPCYTQSLNLSLPSAYQQLESNPLWRCQIEILISRMKVNASRWSRLGAELIPNRGGHCKQLIYQWENQPKFLLGSSLSWDDESMTRKQKLNCLRCMLVQDSSVTRQGSNNPDWGLDTESGDGVTTMIVAGWGTEADPRNSKVGNNR